MMRINSKTRLLLSVMVVMVLVMSTVVAISIATATKVSATDVAFAWSGGTEEDALTELRNAMTSAEAGNNVTLTLNADMNISSSGVFVIGNADETPEGVLNIRGADSSIGIVFGTATNLDFKGNVTFDNIKLQRGSSSNSFYNGSFIIVSEGEGIFGNSTSNGTITNTNSGTRGYRISLAGKKLKVYTGYYYIIGANWRLSGVTIDSPTIVFGGNAQTCNIAGRGIYTDENSLVTGSATLTIQGDAIVDESTHSSAVTGGHYCPSVKDASKLYGDTAVYVNTTASYSAGYIWNFYVLGYNTNGGADHSVNLTKEDGTNSVYTVYLTKGLFRANASLYYIDGSNYTSISGFTCNYTISSNATFGSAVNPFGVYLYNTASQNMTFSGEVNATVNYAKFNGDFYAGTFARKSGAESVVVDNINRNITFNSVTVKGSSVVAFGSRAWEGAFTFEHRGSTTTTLSANIAFTPSAVYGGSHLSITNAKHTGSTSLTLNTNYQKFNNKTLYGGSYLGAAGTEQSGSAELIVCAGKYPGSGTVLYGGSNLVGASSKQSGSTKLSFGEGGGTSTAYLQGNVYGGSNITGTSAVQSGNSELKYVREKR